MASYHARRRDPLLDRTTQALVEKRSKELLGLMLMVLGLVFTLILGSYSPDDPGWMVATDDPARNTFGRAGAAIASTLMIILGVGAWTIPLLAAVWGLRFILHRGADRAVGRMLFAWVLTVAASCYASTHVPGDTWVHAFGMGGLLGDTLLGVMLSILPMATTAALKVSSLILMVAMLAAAAFSFGFVRSELRYGLDFLILSCLRLFQIARHGAQVAGSHSAAGASDVTARLRHKAALRRQAREEALIDEDDLIPASPVRQARVARPVPAPVFEEPVPEPLVAPSKGLRSRVVESLIRRPLEPEWVEPEVAHPQTAAPSEDRIRSRISDAIEAKARKARQPAPVVGRVEPPVLRGRPDVPVMPAVSRAVAAAQARAAAGVQAAPMRFAVQPRSPYEEARDQEIPQMPQAAARAHHPQPVAAAPMVAAPSQAAGYEYEAYVEDSLYDDQYDHLMQPNSYLAEDSFEDDLAGWEEEPRMTAAQALAPARPAPAPLRQTAPLEPYEEAPEEEDEEDDGYAAWLAAQSQPVITRPQPVAPSVAAPVAAPRVTPPPPRAPQPQPAVPVMRAPQPVAAPARPAPRPVAPSASDYETPPLSLLTNPASIERHHLSDDELEDNARLLENVLDDYGVKGEIVSVRPGPVVTMYELEPAPGLKASRVIGLADDIARSMSALSARVSTVPGRSVIGIELPNAWREKVVLREIITARDFMDQNMRLPLALGKDIGGEPIIANLAKMPHLLIAGTTGSGKSVAINTMILSLLYKLTPEECRLIMIDPKMLELSVYDGIPHLLSPVVTDPKKAVVALKWVVGEMEERYRKMSKMGVRNIEGYNGRVREALAKGELFKRTIQTGFDEETGDPVFETDEFEPQPFPYIVVVVDEMADLMMVAGKEIEACIQRLAQMARASGIHLIMATQRPSVDVITGTIKANFPTRISFQVTSKIDSRTILGEMGAEQLLGMGDMLYMAGGGRISRIHGPFVSDEEVEEIVNHLKSFGPPSYMSGVVDGPDDDKADDIDAVLGLGGGENSEDALYDQAVAIVARDRKCSTSYIQRKLGIGYQKAARLVEQMEDSGIVSSANHVGKREILLPEH